MKSETLISGLKWSFLERAAVIVLQIALEIVMARLLVPTDYGILGMIAVVIAFANVFVDGGFSNALIHFQDRRESDYSAVFFLSLGIGLGAYGFLFLAAPAISSFYGKDLTFMLRIIGICILFNAFGVIYRAKMIIQMNFKKQTVYSAVSMLVSGMAGIILAYMGYGVWALITQMLVYTFFYNFFLFLHHRTVPHWNIEKAALKRILGFGSNIFVSSVIHGIYFNAYPVLLGKVYPSKIVGLYTKANQLSIYPAGIFSAVLQRVFFPFLSAIQSDRAAVYQHHLRFVKFYALVFFPLAALVIFFAEPLTIWLLSESWIEIVLPLQILMLASAFFPVIILNMNIFQVVGKSGLFLRTEILTKIIGIVILFLTYQYGFIMVCYGILLQIYLQFALTSIITSHLLKQNLWAQLAVVMKILMLNGLLFAALVYLQAATGFGSLWTAPAGVLLFIIPYLVIIRYFYREDFAHMLHFLQNRMR
ncbi:MAG: lipopolysaccharide biosynthesis protein [Kaistella sp.]|nr:lipopolysaccharide biosynthesis protein [Kaistella sp.]